MEQYEKPFVELVRIDNDVVATSCATDYCSPDVCNPDNEGPIMSCF